MHINVMHIKIGQHFTGPVAPRSKKTPFDQTLQHQTPVKATLLVPENFNLSHYCKKQTKVCNPQLNMITQHGHLVQ